MFFSPIVTAVLFAAGLALMVGMAFKNVPSEDIHTFDAGSGGVRPNRIVKLDSAGTVVEAAAGTDPLLGVALDYQKADRTAIAQGNRVDVAEDGVVEVEAAGALSVNDVITSDANGRATATTTSGDTALGIAQNGTTGAGELVAVKIDRFEVT